MQKTFALLLLLFASLFSIAQNNVGINTTTPHAPLQFDNTLVNRKLVLYEGINNDHQFDGFGVNAGFLRYQIPSTNDAHVFFAGTSSFSSTELFRITGAGRVGIRATTPLIPFDVVGDTIGLRSSPSTWDNIWFHLNGSTANITASGADSGLRFRVGNNISGTYGDGQSLNTVMSLLPDGRIGIGTSTPTSFSLFSNATKNTISGDGNGGGSSSFSWYANQGGYAAQIYNEGPFITSNGLAVKVSNTSCTAFDVSVGPQEVRAYSLFNIQSNGRIGIGTASPASPIDVRFGEARSGMFLIGGRNQTSVDGVLNVVDSSSNMPASGVSTMVYFFNRTINPIGSITHTAFTNAVAYNTTSDTRLKTGIRPTHYGLTDLMAIEVADYQYKGIADAAPQTGFLAQQLYRIFPEAVTKGDDADEKQPYMVDYGKLTPLLVKAVQELKAQVDALQKENEALKAVAPSSLDGRVKKIEALMQKLGMTDAGL